MAGPWIMPAMMAATEAAPIIAGAAAPAAAAGLGAAGAGAAGAGLGAGLGAMSPGVLTAANGMMIPTGISPSVMGALGAGDLGMATSLAGNSLQRGIAGLLSPFKMVNPQTLEPAIFGNKGMGMMRSGLGMMQQGQQQQRQPVGPMSGAPVQQGPPPQMAGNVPTPAQLAAWRRVKGRMQPQTGRMV